jgi:hypothetical protein
MPNEPDSTLVQPADVIAAELEKKSEAVNAAPIKDFGWLVEHRSKNQQLALKLYGILGRERLSNDKDLITAAGFLVSIIFSLWRAVFICPPTYNRNQTLAAAKAFLANVIEDNTIGYLNDKRHQYWAFSYYLNSAALRLHALSSEKKFMRFNFLDPDFREELFEVWHERYDAWVLCHKAAEAAVHKLDTLLSDC